MAGKLNFDKRSWLALLESLTIAELRLSNVKLMGADKNAESHMGHNGVEGM